MDAAMSMDPLVTALLDLAHELPEFPRPLLVGGGFGLYLKQRHLEDGGDERTLLPGELWPPARATEDVDLLLPTEVIVSVDHMRSIREALDRLGYEPEVNYFQFVKKASSGPVKVDLLTCDIPAELFDRVKIKSMRVRPTGDVQLHAYLTREALELWRSPSEFVLRGARSDGSADELRVFVPNAFTYLLMKLHAFRDRVNDERKNLASHHALDLYRIVAMMTRDEYELVQELARRHADTTAVREAADVIVERFGDDRSVGMIRLLTGAQDAGLSRADIRGDEFREVLGELFPRRALTSPSPGPTP
jgi:hypothetical protein